MKYTNLLISGGGIYGITIIGILNILDKYKILSDLKKYLGTSIGSIISLLLVISFSIDEIKIFINNFNFNLLTNKSDDSINMIDNLINNYGINNNYNLKLILENFLHKKNIKKNITFKELYELTNKELIINISCLNEWKSYYINHINYPDYIVVDTIVASCSIPIYFSPIKINDKYFVDGGLYNNRPTEYFSSDLNNTLIITHSLNIEFNTNINNLENYLFNLFVSKLDFNENKTLQQINNFKNVIIYNRDKNISPITLNLSNQDIEKLFNIGIKNGINFIKKNYYFKYFEKKKIHINNIY